MPALRPRIGKKKMKPVNRRRWNQALDDITRFLAKNACIRQTAGFDFAARRTNAPPQALHPDEIVRYDSPGYFREKSSVTAAEVDFDWRFAAKDFAKVEPLKKICWNELRARHHRVCLPVVAAQASFECRNFLTRSRHPVDVFKRNTSIAV